MKRITKRFVIVLSLMILNLSVAQEPTLAYSKKEILKQIKTYEKAYDASYKSWQKEKEKYKKQTKGTYIILAGNLISTNPMIVQDSISGEYFYIKSGTNHIARMGTSVYLSYIKRTNQHQYFGYYYCTIASGVKVDANPDQEEIIFKDNKEELDRLYAAKNATIKIKPPKKLRVNGSAELDYELSNRDEAYSKIKVISHSKNIEVDVDYYVTVEGLKEGDAFIKLQCDSSGKTKTLKFHVYPEYDEVKLQDIKIQKSVIKYEIKDYERNGVNHNYKPITNLDYRLVFKEGDDPDRYKGSVSVTSSDSNIIEVINNKKIKIKDVGTATITISSGKISKKITYNICRESTEIYKNYAGIYEYNGPEGSGSAEVSIYSLPQKEKNGYIIGYITIEINDKHYSGKLVEGVLSSFLIDGGDNLNVEVSFVTYDDYSWTYFLLDNDGYGYVGEFSRIK